MGTAGRFTMSGPIVVGVDGSASSIAAMAWGADDALRMHMPLRIVTAVHRWPYEITSHRLFELENDMIQAARKVLAEAEITAFIRQPDIDVTTQLVAGVSEMVLRDQARDATEVVVGSRGLGGLSGTGLGSVSIHVAEHVHVPVVVVRPEQDAHHQEITVGIDDSDVCEAALGYASSRPRCAEAGCVRSSPGSFQPTSAGSRPTGAECGPPVRKLRQTG